jgi:hypothetical protein
VVEVAALSTAARVAVRDSQDKSGPVLTFPTESFASGPVLTFPTESFAAFVAAVRDGRLRA